MLIDEIENGLHHRVLKDIFSNLLSMAKKFDVQVVATTHSAECIEAAFDALGSGDEEDFTFHRIDQRKRQIKSSSISTTEMLGNRSRVCHGGALVGGPLEPNGAGA